MPQVWVPGGAGIREGDLGYNKVPSIAEEVGRVGASKREGHESKRAGAEDQARWLSAATKERMRRMPLTNDSLWTWSNNKKDDLTASELRALYAQDHDRCALCGIPERKAGVYRWPPGLQLAHILGGPMRVHQPWNVLMLCETCHRAHHDSNVFAKDDTKWPNVQTWMLLVAKDQLGELNVKMLATLWGRTFEYVESLIVKDLPEFFIEQRKQWRQF